MKKLLKPFIIRWLDERALRLPQSVREQLADRFNVSIELVFNVEWEVRKHIVQLIKEW